MHLVMFDIDGTLTETMRVDEECFVRSLEAVFGFTGIDTDWSRYPRATDSGLCHDLHMSCTGRPPTAEEVARVRQHFVQLLTAAAAHTPFAEIPGAGRLLARLAGGDRHRVSLATGAWRDSARLKLAGAGMCFDDHPAATADDALDRESIMRLSQQRAVERHGGPFAGTVYVGDGVWDARACRALRLPFIGIGSGDRAARLVEAGAVRVFPDFSDSDLFMECLADVLPGD